MSSGRARVRMTETEVEAFLEAGRKLQVATVNPDGTPHLTTLFYVLRDGRLAFWTYGTSQKVRNLERDPRLTCLVEDGTAYDELRGVAVTGTAALVRDPADVAGIGTAVVSAMVGGADLGDDGAAEVERQAAKRVGVVVTPTKVVSWDHRKLRG
jgi:PPOX class probable F420-dependent enzyme